VIGLIKDKILLIAGIVIAALAAIIKLQSRKIKETEEESRIHKENSELLLSEREAIEKLDERIREEEREAEENLIEKTAILQDMEESSDVETTQHIINLLKNKNE
jgi:hypothetical protein